MDSDGPTSFEVRPSLEPESSNLAYVRGASADQATCGSPIRSVFGSPQDFVGSCHIGYKWIIYDTIWLFNIAMEHGPFIDGLPIRNGDFPWLC